MSFTNAAQSDQADTSDPPAGAQLDAPAVSHAVPQNDPHAAVEPPPEPPIDYAPLPAGGRLGYRLLPGIGLAIVHPLIYGTALAGLHAAPAQQQFLEAMSAGHLLVSYDQRGMGNSADAGVARSWEERGADLWAVADAAGIERAVLYGVGDAGHTIAWAALQQPDRVLGIIFNRVPVTFTAQPGDSSGVHAAVSATWFTADATHPQGKAQALMEAVGIQHEEAIELAQVWVKTLHPQAAAAQADLLRTADLRPILPRLDMPALIIAPKTRPWLGSWAQALAEGMPRARLVRPDSGGETLGAVHAFLTVRATDVGRMASTLPAALSSTLSASQRAVSQLRRIVVPVDVDVDTGRAVELACRLGQAQRADILLVHVVAVPHVLPLDHPLPEAMLRAERALALGQAIVAEHELRASKRILRDRSVAGAVVRLAKEENADLIVMEVGGDERRSAEGPPGKTAQEILRRASCEVLLDRGPRPG
jgi:pimeloyl-ACP methyl ester carboxylesterase/nucleotide-binding universal stress UspA family protein